MSKGLNVLKLLKAVSPVSGLGARFFPAIKAMPKELLTLVDKPFMALCGHPLMNTKSDL